MVLEPSFSLPVTDIVQCEDLMKKEFSESFIRRRDFGYEYFEGDITQMICKTIEIVMQYDLLYVKTDSQCDDANSKDELNDEQLSNEQLSNEQLKNNVTNDTENTIKYDKIYKCITCNQLFDINTIKKHKNAIIPCDLTCKACMYVCNSKTAYYRHVEKCIKKLTCETCDSVFLTEYCKKKHLYSKIACDFICKVCNLKMNSRSTYKRHVEQFICGKINS
jgi:hypothetical protein